MINWIRLSLPLALAASLGSGTQAQTTSEDLPPPTRAAQANQRVGNAAAALGLTWSIPPRSEGVVVQRVVGGSAASVAGLRSGDVIRVVDGKPIRSLDDLVERIVPGARLAVQYERSGRMWSTVLDIPQDANLPRRAAEQPQPAVRPTLGVTVRTLTNRDRLEAGIPQDISGLLVTQLQPGSPAARDGLPLGSVILTVDNVVMTEPDDLIAMVRSAKFDRPLEIRYWHRGRIARKKFRVAPELMVPRSVLDLERQLDDSLKAPENSVTELEMLRRRVLQLEKQVAELEARLSALEGK